MFKRLTYALWLVVILALGTYLSYDLSRLYVYRAAFSGSYTYDLLFSTWGWLLPVTVFLGVYVGAASVRKEDSIVGQKVMRHDETAFLIHWAHALSTLVLIITGVYLGFLFVPRFAVSVEDVGFVMNLHFVGVLMFMFSVSAHVTDLFVSGKLKEEHLPEKSDFKDAFLHYSAKIGIGKAPKEGKYLASEKLSYPLWIISVGLIIVTGMVKVAQHLWNIPGGLVETATLLHDVAAVLVIANLAAHVVLSSVVPWSWPLLKSMLTGYVPLSYVKHHHVKWYEQLSKDAEGEKHLQEEAPKEQKPSVSL